MVNILLLIYEIATIFLTKKNAKRKRNLRTATTVADSDLKTWINILKKFLEYDISYAVPGHGKVGEKDSVEDMLNYLKTLRDFIANYKKQGIQRFIDRISEDENFVGRKFPELLLDDIRILLQMERKSRRL